MLQKFITLIRSSSEKVKNMNRTNGRYLYQILTSVEVWVSTWKFDKMTSSNSLTWRLWRQAGGNNNTCDQCNAVIAPACWCSPGTLEPTHVIGHVVTTTRVTLPPGSVSTTTTTTMGTVDTWTMTRVLRHLQVTRCLHVPRAEISRGTAEPRPRRVDLTPGTQPSSEVWPGPGAGAVDGRRRGIRPREPHLP